MRPINKEIDVNKNQVAIGVVGTTLTTGILSIVKTVMDGRKERKAIEKQLEQDLENLHAAADIVMAKLKSNQYRGKSFQDIMIDLEFHRIVAGLN